MYRPTKYGLSAIAGLGIISGVVFGFKTLFDYTEVQEKERQENSKLVNECMQIAAGKDGVLDSQEGASMARDFGYNGAIMPDEKVVLSAPIMRGENARLIIGYVQNPSWRGSSERDSKDITTKEMRAYLKSHKSQ